MVVLGINSRAACFSNFHLRHCEIIFFERRRRARIDAENGHRRITRSRLRIIVKETRGIPTGYLWATSDTVQYDREPREVSGVRAEYETVFGQGDLYTFLYFFSRAAKNIKLYWPFSFKSKVFGHIGAS